MKKILLFVFSTLNLISVFAQPAINNIPAPKQTSTSWVDSIFNSMTIDQKIGQLYMIAAYSGGEKMNQTYIEQLIRENQIGGLIFMQGNSKSQAELTNKFQKLSRTPLLISMDAEWGLGMRLTGIKDFPRQIMLGAMQDSTIVYKMAAAIASQCRRLGVHVDFAPVIDINNNPLNPVINFRSFGENKNKVANYGMQYMKGLQDNGIIACAKHFPGHGDTEVDSHKDLPEIKKTLKQLEQLELFPFNQLIQNGLQSVMVAHLNIPAIDNRKNTPTTLSYNAVTDLLKKKMNFNGLIFTDALNMEGVAKYYSPGEIDLKAFEAGNDILLFSQDINAGIKKIKEDIRQNPQLEIRLNESVQKILKAKLNAGLNQYEPIDTQNIEDDINQYISPLRTQIAEASTTLLSDPYQIIDMFKNVAQANLTYVAVGTTKENKFIQALKNLGVKKILYAPTNAKEKISFLNKIDKQTKLIIGVHNMSGYPTNNFGLDSLEISMVNSLSKQFNSITILFGNPYALKNFCEAKGMIVAYDEAIETQEVVAKILSGELKAKGKLPVSICQNYKAGDGILSMRNVLGQIIDTSAYKKESRNVNTFKELNNTRYFNDNKALECCVSPQSVGADIKELDKLDGFIERCISVGAFPGCRILAAKGGKVFYDKPFGYLTQEKKKLVDINTVYDVASVTKVMATTLAIMKLYDEGKLSIEDNLGKYLKITRGTDKEFLKINDILTHQAGLKSWIPFYKETLDANGIPKSEIYQKSKSNSFNIKVDEKLYMNSQWIDTMWKRIISSPLDSRKKYVYSDLDFIFLQKVVENITKKTLDLYVDETFYKPMKLSNTAYNAYQTLPKREIAPSEKDNYFRYNVVQGYVHDMGAAMFGGVSGHAGIFSTATDIATVFQMLLNGGVYDGKRYFKKSTVDLFTAKYSSISRRALGFDKPDFRKGFPSPCSDNVSSKTFGHQGFTGTCVWADPENDIVFVFLSNRTYPSAENKLINSSLNVRETAQAYIYKSLGIANQPKK
ncbi:MAG: serine hydrolase [Chitinophagaceae bacterium]|nr:serine hydrolase [Chitinophagaceae bacterium]